MFLNFKILTKYLNRQGSMRATVPELLVTWTEQTRLWFAICNKIRPTTIECWPWQWIELICYHRIGSISKRNCFNSLLINIMSQFDVLWGRLCERNTFITVVVLALIELNEYHVELEAWKKEQINGRCTTYSGGDSFVFVGYKFVLLSCL